MADTWTPIDDYVPPKPSQEGSWTGGDVVKSVGVGAARTGAGMAGLLRQANEGEAERGDPWTNALSAAAGELQRYLNEQADATTKDMTPMGRSALESPIWSEATRDHPVGTLVMKLANMLPGTAAAVVPAIVIPQATLAAMAGNGIVNAGEAVNNVYKMVDQATEEQLLTVPYYRELRSMGVDEFAARQDYNRYLRGHTAEVNFLVGTLTGALGPAGQLARVARGGTGALTGAGATLPGRMLAGAAEGGVGEFIEESVQDYTQQKAEMRGGARKEVDWAQVVHAGIEGGTLGGLVGGVAGMPRGAKPSAKADDTVRSAGPGPKGVGTGNAPPPPADATVGDPQNKPVESDRTKYASKGAAAVATSKKKSAPEPVVEVDPALQVAAQTKTAENPPKPDADKIIASVQQTVAAEQAAATVEQAMQPQVDPRPAALIEVEKRIAARKAAQQQQVTQPVTPPVAPVTQPVTGAAPVQLTPQVTPPVVPQGVPEVPPTPQNLTSGLPTGLSSTASTTPAGVQPGAVAERRILESTTPEAEALRAKQLQVQLANEKAALATPKTTSGVAKYGKNEIAARAERDTIADETVKKFPTRENETLAQAMQRAVDIVQEAEPRIAALKEKHALKGEQQERAAKIPGLLRGKAESYTGERAALVTLREARDFVAWMNRRSEGKKKPTLKEVEARVRKFQNAERAPELVVQQRREEGDAAKKRTASNLEELATTKEAGHGDVGDSVFTQSPEEALEAKQEEDTSTEITESVAAPGAAEKLAKVRALKERPGTEGEGAAALAAEKRIEREGVEQLTGAALARAEAEAEVAARRERARKEGAAPAAPTAQKAPVVAKKGERQKLVDLKAVRAKKEAERNTVTPEVTRSAEEQAELDALIAAQKAEDIAASPSPSAAPTPFERAPATERLFVAALGRDTSDATTHLRFADERTVTKSVLPGTRSTTLRRALRSLVASRTGGVIAEKGWMGLVRERIIAASGDVQVHVLKNDVWDALVTGRFTGRGIPAAFYNSTDHAIYIPERLMSAPYFTQIMFHEAVHAATSRAIQRDPKVAIGIEHIMREVAELHPDIVREYGFANPEEFLAEALSNAAFQQKLGETNISPALAQALGMKAWKRATMFEALVDVIRKVFKLGPEQTSALEAAIRMTEFAAERNQLSPEQQVDIETIKAGAMEAPLHSAISMMEQSIIEQSHDAIQQFITRPVRQDQRPAPWLLAVRTMNQIADAAEKFFPVGNNPVRKIYELTMRAQTYAKRKFEESEPVIKRDAELQQKYADTDKYETLAELEINAANVGAHPDVPLTHAKNKHLHHKKIEHLTAIQARAAHVALHKAFNALPEDLQAHYRARQKYFKAMQDEATLGTIRNMVMYAIKKKDDALAQRIFDDKLTAADVKELGGKDAVKVIQDAFRLKTGPGPYVPQMRHGTHVAVADVPIMQHKNATVVPDKGGKTFEFKGKDARKEATQYARDLWGAGEHYLPATVQKVWTDANGRTHVEEVDAEGVTHEVRISSQDTVAEPRYRVTVQNEHVEFLPTAKEALVRSAELEKAYGADAVKGARKRRHEPKSGDNSMTPPQMETLIRSLVHRKGYGDMTPSQQAMLKAALHDFAVTSYGSTRISSRRLPRRKVKGASTNVPYNTYLYAHSMSQYLGKLEYSPELEAARKEIHDGEKGDYSKGTALGRSEITHEIDRRLAMPLFEETKDYHAWIKRAMTVSFLDKLAGPSWAVINAMQPGMITAPVMAARHGWGKTFMTMRKAYSDIGGLTLLGIGAKNMGATFKGRDPGKLSDQFLKGAKTDGERAMMQHAMDVNAIDPEAGIEISQESLGATGWTAKLDKGLDWSSTLFRQIPHAIEAINRASTALSAYRLELERTGDHDKASAYAIKTVEQTHFVYNFSNLPPLFKHPVARIALQFKSYGQGIYSILGTNLATAISKHSDRAERMEAIKTLRNIAAMHMVMAGALGLPTEPIKYLLMPFQVFGGPSMDDVEHRAREIAARMFGKTVGEVAMKGLPRLMGIDIAGRVGMSDFTSYGEPHKNTEEHVLAWVVKNLGGAPTALGIDMILGAQKLAEGEFLKASELMVPLKTYTDAVRAYRQGTEGKMNKAGTRQTSKPYSAYEIGLRAVGFGSGREAEEGAEKRAFYKRDQSIKDARQALTNDWLSAKPAEKRAAMSAITKWNKGQPENVQIKMSELSASAKRLESSRKNEVRGVVTNKRNEHLMRESPYNAGVAQRVAGKGAVSGGAGPIDPSLHGLFNTFATVPTSEEALEAMPVSTNIEDRRMERGLNDYKKVLNATDPRANAEDLWPYTSPTTDGELGALYRDAANYGLDKKPALLRWLMKKK